MAIGLKFAALLASVLLAGCAASPYPPAVNPPAHAERPVIRVGDTWTYRMTDGYTQLDRGTVTYTVTAVRADDLTVKVATDGGQSEMTYRYTPDWNWLDQPLTNLQRFQYEPAYPAFRFPLQSGEQWNAVRVDATDPATGKTYRPRIDGRVLGWERVTTPAGVFDAIKVYRAVYSATDDYFRSQEYIEETDWYAPAVNRIVVSSARSTYQDKTAINRIDGGWRRNDWILTELVSYTPAIPR